MHQPLLIHNIRSLVTMDLTRRILPDAFLVIRDGRIESLGSGPPPRIEGVGTLDARGGIALPGLINTHHHMIQNLVRAWAPIVDQPLYGWLMGLVPVWKNARPADARIATQVALAELMLSGCTMTADHHYVFTGGSEGWIEGQFEAAKQFGIRFHLARGAMDTPSEIYKPWALQSINDALGDIQRAVAQFHDRSPESFSRVAPAPVAVLSASADLYREAARLATDLDLRLHTHCGETLAERERFLRLFGKLPLDVLREAGWTSHRTWLAHGIHFDDAEVAEIGARGMGVAHCPTCNMRLGSGICRVNDLRRAGAIVALGVDGSASNDSGHLLAEARQALLLTRVAHGPGAMRVMDALELATLQGARCLGREKELGSLEVGKLADIAIFPAEDLASSGAHDKVEALLLCLPRQVDSLIIQGRIRIRDGRFTDIDLPPILERHREAAHRLQNAA
jgi:8-oxoguanine deaminase